MATKFRIYSTKFVFEELSLANCPLGELIGLQSFREAS